MGWSSGRSNDVCSKSGVWRLLRRIFPRFPIVEQVGAEVSDIKVGQEVYGLTAFDRDGSEAEYTLALPAELAPKPSTLAHVQAAAVPLSGLTAWQALFDQAHVLPGQTILIHGAAGGVGPTPAA